MDALQNILHAEIIQKLGWTLLHFVWQAAAIGLFLAIVLRLMRKFTANLRYIAACVAMTALVVLPAITIQILEVDTPIETTPPANRQTVDSPQTVIKTTAIAQIAEIELPQTQATAVIDDAPLTDRFIYTIEPALPFAVIIWLGGVFGLSIWHLGGWAQLQKLRRQMVRQVEPSLKANMLRLSDAMGIWRAVNLMESSLVQVPVVIGHFKPVILLPVSALTGLSTDQIEAILAHELAHIKRNDYLVNMLQTVVEILGFYHPAVWWVSHIIRVERENCCDDMAIGISGDKVGYVRTLALMEEIRAAQPGLAVAASGASLFDRVKRLIGKDGSDDEKANWLPSVVAVLLIAALLIPTALALTDNHDSSDADTIIQKVITKYENIKTYSAQGHVIGNIIIPDSEREILAKIDPQFKSAPLHQKTNMQFNSKLAKSGQFCIQWQHVFNEEVSSLKSAIWSTNGQDKFIHPHSQSISAMSSKDIFEKTANINSKITLTIPPLVLDIKSLNLFEGYENPVIKGIELLNDENCYVLSGKIEGVETDISISQKTFLIMQVRRVLAGNIETIKIEELTDEAVKEFLLQTGMDVTDQNVLAIKNNRKLEYIKSKVKGTITETYNDIVIDQPAAEMVFEPDIEMLKKSEPLAVCEPAGFDPNGEEMKLLDGIPIKAREISGTVVDENGKPIEGVLADVWTWYRGNEDTTDKEGRFSINKFHPDDKTVEIRFSKEGFTPRYIIRQPVGIKDAKVVLTQNTYFEGIVTDSKGKPVPNAQIRANPGPKYADGVMIGEVWTETKSDENGKYRLYVQTDTYDIQTKASEGVCRLPKIKIEKGQSQKLDIQLEAGIVFRAYVKDSQTGEPIEGFKLFKWKSPGMEGTSDSAGIIEIKGMIPGKIDFDVDAKKSGRWWSQDCVSEWNRWQIYRKETGWQRNFDGLDFDIQTDMPPVTIEVEKPVRITGKVVDPDGNPVEGATATLAHTGSGNSITGDGRYSFKTDKDGNFEMLVPASNDTQYNLIAHDGKYNQWRNWANGVLQPIQTKPGDVLENVVITLNNPGSVKGKVINKDGKPVANNKVRSHAFDKLGNRYYDPESRTDANGEFEIKFIRPGTHYIQSEPYWMYAEEAPEGTSQIVAVQAGETVNGITLIRREINDRPSTGKSTEQKIEDFKQLLEKPVTVNLQSQENGKLSIQYAVIAICNAAKVPYNWNKSAELAGDKCRLLTDPVKIEGQIASKAIKDIIREAGLDYDVDDGGVCLYKRQRHENTAKISGTVLSDENNMPISNALVRVAVPAADMRMLRIATDHKIYETHTNNDGKFEINVSVGDAENISVDALAPGFRSAAGTYRSGGDFSLYKIPLKSLLAEKNYTFRILLPKALYISGVIKNSMGEVISGVQVSGQMAAFRSHGGIATVQSDENGKFEMFDFPVTKNFNETGVLKFSHPQYIKLDRSNIYELTTDELKSLQIVMDKGVKVTGVTLDDDNKPLANIKVEATTEPGVIYKECISDSNGRFELAGLENGHIQLNAFSSDFSKKATQDLTMNDQDQHLTLNLQNIVQKQKTYTLLGMQVADITPELKEKYNIHSDSGVLIIDPGKEQDRLEIGKLEPGYCFWMVGNKEIANIKELVSEILRINSKPKPTGSNMIPIGHEGMILVVYTMRGGTNTQYLKLTPEMAAQLRELGRELNMPENQLYEGVVTADSPEEKELRERLYSGSKLSQLGKAIYSFSNTYRGSYPENLEALKTYFDSNDDFDWIIANVEYLGKDKNRESKSNIVIAYDKTMLTNSDAGTNILYNDGHVEFNTSPNLKETGITKGENHIQKSEIQKQ